MVVRSVIGKTGVIEADVGSWACVYACACACTCTFGVVTVPVAPAPASVWLLKAEEGTVAAWFIFVESTFECTCSCACACAALPPALSG